MKSKLYFPQNIEDRLKLKEIRTAVRYEIIKSPNKAIRHAQIRAITFPVSYFITYLSALYFHDIILVYILHYCLMGLLLICIFLNLIHDLVHRALFKSRRINSIMLRIFDLIGANSFIWKIRHCAHHRYNNISGADADIEQASLIRIYPHDQKRWFHSIQHRMIFLLYPLYLINWVFVRDFKDFFKKDQVVTQYRTIPRQEYFKLFIFKGIFITYTVIIPVYIGVPVVWALWGVFIMLLVAGTFSLAILLTPHVNITNAYPLPNEVGELPSSWIEHQFNTTNDVKVHSVISKFFGNFNHHIAHHIFPRLASVHLPIATKVIMKYAGKFELNYRSYTLKEALVHHYKLIKSNAIDQGFFEEDM